MPRSTAEHALHAESPAQPSRPEFPVEDGHRKNVGSNMSGGTAERDADPRLFSSLLGLWVVIVMAAPFGEPKAIGDSITITSRITVAR